MPRIRNFALGTVLVMALWVLLTSIPDLLDPSARSAGKKARDRKWVNTSPYFLDRQVCRWFMLCGLHHVRPDPAARPYYTHGDDHGAEVPSSWEDTARLELARRAEATTHDGSEQATDASLTRDVPDYVIKYAPLVHLYSDEQFWPSDIGTHLEHMDVAANVSNLDPNTTWTLDNLRGLNDFNTTVYLHSQQDVERRPAWLHSADNIPTDFHGHSAHPSSTHQPHHPHAKPPPPITAPPRPMLPRGHKPDKQGYSSAPAVLVLVDKGAGVLDAFWFFFYSYNLGQSVLGVRYGNHVGDWEHCMVRFEHGEPRGLFLSAHEGGHAYAWDALQKQDNRTHRPVIYSALGSHAMYATPGDHPYVLPFNLLRDQTDAGPVWDPALNKLAYFYDFAADDEDMTFPNRTKVPPVQVPQPEPTPEMAEKRAAKKDTLAPAASNADAPTSWFHYKGKWGDEMYTLADERQWRLFGQYHYVTGPTGPKSKRLGRSLMCTLDKCEILHELDRLSTWY